MNLLAYIQGNRKGKEAHRIEKEAMRDLFLADALDGYDEVKADHASNIAHLRSRMPSTTRHTGQQKIYMGIAASLLFCLVVGGYFLLNKKPENLIAMSESHEQLIAEEEFIELSPLTETPSSPAQNYLIENEHAAAAQSEMRQRAPSSSPSPVSPTSPIVTNDAYTQGQAEIFVTVEEEEMEVAMDEELVAAHVAVAEAMKEETDRTAADALGAAAVAESNSAIATRAIRIDFAKPLEPQIGTEAYEKYLKDAMIPLKKEECAINEGVVEVEFTIKKGKPSDFVIRQSFCDAASKEAIRLIENGCLWIGEDGQTVGLKVNF